MDFNQTALELEKHQAYLNEISKEDIVHIIKSVIFHLEQKKIFQEEELKKINLTVLTNEPFNNLYFKYIPSRRPLKRKNFKNEIEIMKDRARNKLRTVYQIAKKLEFQK